MPTFVAKAPIPSGSSVPWAPLRWRGACCASLPVCTPGPAPPDPAKSTAQAARDGFAREQCKAQAEHEAADVGPPDIGAITRSGVAEQQLQQDPDADQQKGRHAHKLKIKPSGKTRPSLARGN